MSDVRFPETPANDLDAEWRLLREAALIAEREYRLVAQRLRAEANRFEIAKERLEIAGILEKHCLTKLEAHRRQRAGDVQIESEQ